MLVFLLFKKESESDYMLTIETKELNITEELKKKVDMICKFDYVKPTITNGNIKGTNIAYVKINHNKRQAVCLSYKTLFPIE